MVILIGNLGADPELRSLPNGDSVCSLRIATTDKWKDQSSGEQKESTEWHRVVLFRRLGEIAGQYLRKGDAVFIEGKLRTRKWKTTEGLDRYSTEIEANSMQMLSSQRGQHIPPSTEQQPQPFGMSTVMPVLADDDFPF